LIEQFLSAGYVASVVSMNGVAVHIVERILSTRCHRRCEPNK
jgi:hypothetical protein